jgi:hypothetical protein
MWPVSHCTGQIMKNTYLIFITSLFMAVAANIQAADSGSRYQTWQRPTESTQPQAVNDDRMQKMIDELNKLIDDADKVRAADRRFIEDLRDVVNQYDWPWRKMIMDEDFTDGYMNKDSNWKIVTGKFQLERGLGLYSDIQMQQPARQQPEERESKEDAAALLLGAILDQALSKKNEKEESSEPATPLNPDHAMIASKKPISNAFAIDMNLDVRSVQGQYEIGVYQGSPDGAGYRLVFLPGSNASLELQRIGGRGKSIIEAADKISAAGDRVHQLQWTRTKQGNMQITLNGKTVIQTADRSFKDAFTGIVLNNEEGEFSMKQLTVQGS